MLWVMFNRKLFVFVKGSVTGMIVFILHEYLQIECTEFHKRSCHEDELSNHYPYLDKRLYELISGPTITDHDKMGYEE